MPDGYIYCRTHPTLHVHALCERLHRLFVEAAVSRDASGVSAVRDSIDYE